MASSLTVAQARQNSSLWTVADPSDQNSSLFLPLLNQASEAIINSGLWKGMYGEINFPAIEEFITLPRQWEAIVADHMQCYGAPPVIGRFQEFSSQGTSYFPSNQAKWCMNALVDHGWFPTERIQLSELPTRITILNALDAGLSGRIYGTYLDGLETREWFGDDGEQGIPYTTSYPYVDIPQAMFVRNIVLPQTRGYKTLSTVDGLTVRELSSYQPTEVNPLYRRYRAKTLDVRSDGNPVLRLLCKRKFIPMVAETDYVYPSEIRALNLAMSACKLEQQGAYEVGQSQGFWSQCYQTLNDSLRQQRGNIRTPAVFNLAGSAGSIPRTH